MLRALILLLGLLPAVALAQGGHEHMGEGPSRMDHREMMRRATPTHDATAGTPTQPGQGAFAAIQEIVAMLEADPSTDWSRVDIEALRQHLVDMNNVTLMARVKNQPIEGGVRFIITGAGEVVDSIRRMAIAHAATMNGVDNWRFVATESDLGATLDVTAPSRDIEKLKALGFIGIMTRGMHHQQHHLMIARGGAPHH